MQVKTKGIIISETNYSETSKILNILTEEYGLIGVISKGCRNIKSKLRGVSNKMNYCEFIINYKEKGLSTLIEGSNLNSFKNIYNDMRKASFSFYLMDLFNQVIKENNHHNLFNLLENALIKINDGLNEKLICLIIEIKLLDYLGVSINLNNCVICGKDDNIFTISISDGGLICKDCYHDGYIFNDKTLKLFLLLAKIDLSKIKKLELTNEYVFQEIDQFLDEYYNYYTGIYLGKKDKLDVFK